MDIFLQYFLAPILTGLIVFLAQFFLLPKLEETKTLKKELWIEKKNTFIKALELVNEKYETLGFGKKQPSEFTKLSEANRIYGNLVILSQNREIPESFWKLFDNSRKELQAIERGNFIVLLQKALGQESHTEAEKMPIFIDQKEK